MIFAIDKASLLIEDPGLQKSTLQVLKKTLGITVSH